MKLLEYKEEVKRTLPDLGTVLVPTGEMQAYRINLNTLHTVLGMGTELEELSTAILTNDKVNMGEEITDLLWYACNHANLYDVTIDFFEGGNEVFNEEPNYGQLELLFHDITVTVSRLQDFDKKALAYGKPINRVKVEEELNNLLGYVEEFYQEAALDKEKCMQNNIDKLRVRFPDKFNNEQAINRNLEQELKELKK